MRRVLDQASGALLSLRGRGLVWAPVWLSLGIGAYFALRAEPPPLTLALAGAVCLAGLWLSFRGTEALRPVAAALALAAAGLILATVRANVVAAPVLPWRYYGIVEGRVTDIDRSFSDQIRVTLDRVRLEERLPGQAPARVRVALHGDAAAFVPEPGQRLHLLAHLSPPEGPVAPGGFDFQRLAWFSQLGAVGYARRPVMVLSRDPPGAGQWAFSARMALSRAMQDAIPGQPGALASSLMTGDRSGLVAVSNDALRAANLSHLISISGLHMGLLTGFVFGCVRYGLALAPPLALRVNARKVGAAVALLAATGYLFLAGPNVATERAYIMAVVMLAAVLTDRRAVTMRSVAIAALIVLALEPESLIEPGFQMSFAATVALVAAFRPWAGVQARVPALLRPAAMLILSSLAAGAATAPFAAAHFNRVAEYGLVANLIAVPVMGLIVMPAGVVAAVLAPIGLAQPALWVMGLGTDVILRVARWVAGLDGAVVAVPTPPALVLPLVALGGATLLVGRLRILRLSGAAAVAVAAGLWSAAARPDVLIAPDGTLVGVMTEAGRALSKPKGSGFVATSWLEDDGDLAAQDAAYARGAFWAGKGEAISGLAAWPIAQFSGKSAVTRGADACRPGVIVILTEDWEGQAPACTVLDRRRLQETGAVALWRGTPLRVTTARSVTGDRLWSRWPEARDQ